MRTATVIWIMLVFFQLHGNCQISTDAEFIFKTQLFLEKANVANAKGFESKDMELFIFFSRNINLRLDTLQSFGFSGNYFFFSLSMKKGVTYNGTTLKSDSSFLLFIGNDCSDYILAINKYTGKSYRLKGFGGNDFINLFFDINREFERLNEQKITIKRFLKDYHINSVDFGCLYNALKSGEYNKTKYPCLKGCEVMDTVIH